MVNQHPGRISVMDVAGRIMTVVPVLHQGQGRWLASTHTQLHNHKGIGPDGRLGEHVQWAGGDQAGGGKKLLSVRRDKKGRCQGRRSRWILSAQGEEQELRAGSRMGDDGSGDSMHGGEGEAPSSRQTAEGKDGREGVERRRWAANNTPGMGQSDQQGPRACLHAAALLTPLWPEKAGPPLLPRGMKRKEPRREGLGIGAFQRRHSRQKTLPLQSSGSLSPLAKDGFSS